MKKPKPVELPEPEYVPHRIVTGPVRLTVPPQVVALDIETTTAHTPTIIGISGRTLVSIFPAEDLRPLLFFLRQCPTLVGHNATGFDAPILDKTFGVTLNMDDTMLAAYAVNENEPSYSLEALAVKYLGIPPWKQVTWDWDNISEEQLAQVYAYNAHDVNATKRLWDLYLPKLHEENVYPLYKHILVPFARTLYNIEERGVYLDDEQVAKLEVEIGGKVAELEAELLGYGLKNPRSPKQVGALLYGELNFEPITYTKTKQPSTDELTLKKLGARPQNAEQRAVIDALLAYRENHKLLSTYVTTFRRLIDKYPDHRAHPSYSQIATATGRSNSFGEFNAQTIPRDKRMRAIIAAPPGKALVIGDLAQIEMRIAAFLSRSPNMLRAFTEDRDVHRMLGATITGKLEADVTDLERQDAKSANFALLYYGTEDTLIDYAFKTFGVRFTYEEAERIVSGFRQMWKLDEWYERIWDELKETRCVRSPLRTYHFAEKLKASAYSTSETVAVFRAAVNYPVQGTAHYLAACAANLIEQEIGWIVHFGHDSVIVEVPESEQEAAASIVKTCMERQAGVYLADTCGIEIDVPIAASVAVRSHW